MKFPLSIMAAVAAVAVAVAVTVGVAAAAAANEGRCHWYHDSWIRARVALLGRARHLEVDHILGVVAYRIELGYENVSAHCRRERHVKVDHIREVVASRVGMQLRHEGVCRRSYHSGQGRIEEVVHVTGVRVGGTSSYERRWRRRRRPLGPLGPLRRWRRRRRRKVPCAMQPNVTE